MKGKNCDSSSIRQLIHKIHDIHNVYPYIQSMCIINILMIHIKDVDVIIVAITNQKGGVGKTTTATALGAGLQNRGKRTLLVDTDPQGNASDTYCVNYEGHFTVYDLMIGNCTAQQAIQNTKVGAMIPGDLRLSAADMQFTKQGREYLLKKALEPMKAEYDYIILDTPPALGIITINALTAADTLVIPMIADRYSLQGISQLSETIETVREYSNPQLLIDGILLTRFNSRTVLGRDIKDTVDSIARTLKTRLYSTEIRQSVSIQESQTVREDIFSFAPESTTAQDYLNFISEFLKNKEDL